MNDEQRPSEFKRRESAADLAPLLGKLLQGKTLSADDASIAFGIVMRGEAHESEIGALLALLATRTPTNEELLGAARVMRANVDPVPTSIDPKRIVDTAGTGGAPKMFNVSTVAAVIAAAAGREHGMVVAKHGNRSRTGRGSAEVLQRLGVNVDADRATQAKCLEDAAICFCFAIHHHPATRHVMAARKALGFATIFNLLGPLTNPAGAKRQVMGVYADRFVQPVAETLRDLGATRAMVVHSRDGLDELTITAPTRIAHIDNGRVYEEELECESLGLARASFEQLQATTLDEAACIFRAILSGEETGPKRDMVLLNAAATLLVGGAAESLGDGLERARGVIEKQAALQTLAKLIAISNQ